MIKWIKEHTIRQIDEQKKLSYSASKPRIPVRRTSKSHIKLLRKIAELKEECALEQTAKAHMEEALRNDIEERDKIISTLVIKIDILRENVSDDGKSTPSVNFVNLLDKCKRLNEELSLSDAKCALLEMEIKSLKNSEKSARLHLVENKISNCKELEKKECQTKKFENIINDLQMENQILNEKAVSLSACQYQLKAKEKLESIQNAYSTFKSDCVESLKYFKTEVMEKYNEDVMNKVMIIYNEELEKQKVDLQTLNEENDCLKANEQKAAVKANAYRKTLKDLQCEYSEYKVNHERKIQDVEITARRKISKLTNDLFELKKNYRNEVAKGVKNDIEMEYLRNILYNYMMGKQPMVLVKVLAAIVKFDSVQVNAILQREEQKVLLESTSIAF